MFGLRVLVEWDLDVLESDDGYRTEYGLDWWEDVFMERFAAELLLWSSFRCGRGGSVEPGRPSRSSSSCHYVLVGGAGLLTK
jgi:hypothetical protein